MDDLTEKLIKMLGSKENIEKIKNFSKVLKDENLNSENTSETLNEEDSQNGLQDFPADTLNIVMKLMPILSSINKEDKNTKFLGALRPLLSEKRQKKLDESMKMMQMMKVLPLFKEQGIFNF